MYVVNGSDGRCIVAVRLIVGVRYLERPLREVLLYTREMRQPTRVTGSLRSQLYSRDLDFLNDLERSLSNVCYN